MVFLQQETPADSSMPTGTKHYDSEAVDANGNCRQEGRIEVPIEVPIDSSRGMDGAPRFSA